MAELGKDARRLVEGYRQSGMPEQSRREVLRDLQHSVAVGLPPRLGEDPSSAPPRASRWRWALGGGLTACAAALLGLYVLEGVSLTPSEDGSNMAAAYEGREAPTRGQAEHRAPSGPRPDRAEADEAAVPEESSTDPSAEPRAPEVERARPSRARRSSPQSRPKADADDGMALLIDARRAIQNEEYAVALSRLRRHERAHPGSRFAEERLVLRVRAQCGAGQLREAKATIERGRSPSLTARLRAACPVAGKPGSRAR